MSLLTARNLGKFYGDDHIFGGISLAVAAGDRIGLVGANGVGKTSLLDILAGRQLATTGQVTQARSLRLGYLPQRPELAGQHSLWQEQLRAFGDLLAMSAELEALEQALPGHPDALDRYGSLQAEFERRGGYSIDARIKMALTGLGFAADEYNTPLPQLSGGQKTRALLSRLLLEEADLLLLDEPTNHLDIQAVEWLENALADYPGAVLAVSHDRRFLENAATTIWELEAGALQAYRGNYSAFLKQRDLRRDHQRKRYQAQQAHIAKERAYIRKHMGSRWTAQAKGRAKKLDTMRKRGRVLDDAPRDRRKMFMAMDDYERSGDQALRIRDLQIGYAPAQPLLRAPDAVVLRGDVVAIIGPNGVGKSTLLKTLAGDLAPLNGQVQLGAKVKVGYFAQAHEKLESSRSLLDEIIAAKAMPISAARDFLGRFMFSADDVFRQIATLSGGERGRVALAKLALLGANLLLLDEPTNHLDTDSQEVLQAVLEGFGGAILLVSHDRYLIDALATQIWEMSPGRLTISAGDYQHYTRQRKIRLQQSADERKRSASSAQRNGGDARSARRSAGRGGLNPFQAAQRAAHLEDRVARLEAQIQAISQRLEHASAAGDVAKVRELGQAYAAAQAELDEAMEAWGQLL